MYISTKNKYSSHYVSYIFPITTLYIHCINIHFVFSYLFNIKKMNCYRLERFQIRLFIYYSMKSPCTYWFSPYVINQFILLQFIDLINASINVSVGSPNLYGCSEALHNLASYETVITECTYSRQTITLLQTDVRVNNSSTTHSPRPFS